jgi:Asp-tRNA(Asn)/Glu-tRNA(Gln) amidotransferase A subunit family amidase
MNPNPLIRWSLRELSTALQSGELTPTRLTGIALESARRSAAARAFLMIDEAGAQTQAQALEGTGPGGPLWGLPVSVKDLFDVRGLPTTCGSPFYAGTRPVPQDDCPYVADWRAQGTVLVGKTNLNEFAYGITGENRWYGDVTQPGHPDRLTGGSSSGAAASVLMGAAAIGLGTDTGGSLRAPAALCGLVSYRATLGSEDAAGSFPLAHAFDTLGWLQRSLGDLAWVARNLRPEIPSTALSRAPRVGVVRGDWLAPAEPEVLAGMERFVEALKAGGAGVDSVEGVGWERAVDCFVPIQAHEAHGTHARYLTDHAGAYDPAILPRLELGRGISAGRHAELLAERDAFRRGFDLLFQRFDVLIAPASAMRVLEAGADHAGTRPRMIRLTAPASLGGLPVVTVPWIEGGEPGLGFQCMGAPGADGLLWSFAEWLADRGHPEIP